MSDRSFLQAFYDFLRNKWNIPADQFTESVKSVTQDGFADIITIKQRGNNIGWTAYHIHPDYLKFVYSIVDFTTVHNIELYTNVTSNDIFVIKRDDVNPPSSVIKFLNTHKLLHTMIEYAYDAGVLSDMFDRFVGNILVTGMWVTVDITETDYVQYMMTSSLSQQYYFVRDAYVKGDYLSIDLRDEQDMNHILKVTDDGNGWRCIHYEAISPVSYQHWENLIAEIKMKNLIMVPKKTSGFSSMLNAAAM